MKKLILTLITIISFVSCSNLNLQKSSSEKKNLLSQNLINVQKSLKSGDTSYLNSFFQSSVRNNAIINEMKNIDFSRISTFYTEPIIYNNQAENIVAFSFNGRTFYYSVNYRFINGEWKILDFIEKRG